MGTLFAAPGAPHTRWVFNELLPGSTGSGSLIFFSPNRWPHATQAKKAELRSPLHYPLFPWKATLLLKKIKKVYNYAIKYLMRLKNGGGLKWKATKPLKKIKTDINLILI